MLHASRTVMPLFVVLAFFVSPLGAYAQAAELDGGVADPAAQPAESEAGSAPSVEPPPPASAPTAVYPPAPYYPQPAPVDRSYGYAPGTTAYAPGPTLIGGGSRLGAPGAREHEGLFLRLTIGAGAGFMRYREAVDGVHPETVETGGVSGEFEIAMGGRVVGNLIVHGNLLVSGVSAANKTVSGVKDASTGVDTNLALFGGGLTYYFMPQNVYVSGMLGIGAMSETRNNHSAVESRTGVGGGLMVGKEWWMGRREEWGVGAALRGLVLGAPVTVAGVDSRMRGSQITIVFSATLN